MALRPGASPTGTTPSTRSFAPSWTTRSILASTSGSTRASSPPTDSFPASPPTTPHTRVPAHGREGHPPFELIASGVRLHSCGRHHHGDQSPRHHGDTRPGQVGSRAHTTLPRSHQHVLVDRPAETHHLIEVVRGVHRVVRSNPKSPGNSTQSGERRSRAMPCATPHGSPAGLPCGRCHLVKYPVSLHTGTGVTS